MASYRGTSRADMITGSPGADTLEGLAGNDTLAGGRGADSLTGGKGSDVILYGGSSAGLSTAAASDTVIGFSRDAGDKISFAGLELTGNGAPGQLGWAGTTPAAWAVWQGGKAGKTVNADSNGDGVADLVIVVKGGGSLGASDFLGLSGDAPGGDEFRLVMSDSFDGGYNASHWGQPFDGGIYWNGAFSWSASDVNQRDGEMQVRMTRHADGSWTAGGFNSFKAGVSIHYGTVEFDARVEEAQGTVGAFLMWPASDRWPPEIDILETPGQDVLHTLHWDDGGDTIDYVRNQAFDETRTQHYKMTWLPNDLRVEVGGRTVAHWTEHVPNEAMGFGMMGLVGAPTDYWMDGAPDSSTPDEVTIHLDNFVMSQWSGIGG